jgi:hypothetical protein
LQDNAMPSGNARAASVLFRLGLLSGNSQFLSQANDSVAALSENMARYPMGFGEWLSVASIMLGEPRELALIGDAEELGEFKAELNAAYRPDLVVAAAAENYQGNLALLKQRSKVDGKAAAYLCQQFVCKSPVTDVAELKQLLRSG